jgi:hypothetical protein
MKPSLTLGWGRVCVRTKRQPLELWACGPPKVMEHALCPATTFHENVTLSFVIPERSRTSCLQFRGPLLERGILCSNRIVISTGA